MNSKFKIQNSKFKRGFTLVELILVMSIMGTLLGLVTVGLSNVRQRTTINTLTQTFVADVRQQQIKAMVGDTQGGGASDYYGVHIDPDKYVLFRGATYSATDPNNFAVALPNSMQFINPALNIVFDRLSGVALNDNGLAGYWNFDEGVDQIVGDSSDFNNDGTRGTDSSPGTDDPTWALGKPGLGGALSFDGNDWVEIPSPTPSPVLSTTSPFSISLWANKTAGTTGYRNLVSIPFSATDGFEILIASSSFHEPLSFGSRASSSFTVFRKAPATGDHTDYNSVWTHVVLTYNGSGGTTIGNFALYENGISQALEISGSFANFGPTFAIGSAFGSVNFWRGLIDEVRIYNRVLSVSEISSLYAVGKVMGEVQLQLQDTTNSNTKAIEINRYGVITAVN